MGEIAVGRKNDETFAVEIEPAGTKKAKLGELPRKQFEYRGGVMRIVIGTDQAARLVNCDRNPRLAGGAHRFAADSHLIDAGNNFVPGRGDDAIDPNLALSD